MTTRFASTAPLLTKPERDLLSHHGGTELALLWEAFFFADASLRQSGMERARELATLAEGPRTKRAERAGVNQWPQVAPPSASVALELFPEEEAA